MSGKRALRFSSEADMPPAMRQLYAKQLQSIPKPLAPGAAVPEPSAPKVARGRAPHVPGRMNKTEQAYADHLERQKQAGEILWWAFEKIKLRLAEKTFLTVDFFVQMADLSLEAHETKGWWEDDARVKVKVAASMYPFRFLGVQRKGGQWKFEHFPGGQ